MVMDRTLGRQIQALRREAWWTTEQLATELALRGAPVSWRSIEGWEQGRRRPSAAAMAALRQLGLIVDNRPERAGEEGDA